MRSVATIEAQPAPAPVSPTAAAEAPVADALETRVRDVATIDPSPVEDRTLLRSGRRSAEPVVSDTARRPESRTTGAAPQAPADVEPIAAGPTAASRPRKGRLGLIAAIAAVVLVGGAVATAVALTGTPQVEATQSAAPDDDPADAIVGGAVPAPVDGVATRSADGTSVVFQWSNPAPEDGDSYRWWRSEQPGSPNAAPETVATVGPVDPAQRVCITVVLLRGGQTGDELEVCTS